TRAPSSSDTSLTGRRDARYWPVTARLAGYWLSFQMRRTPLSPTDRRAVAGLAAGGMTPPGVRNRSHRDARAPRPPMRHLSGWPRLSSERVWRGKVRGRSRYGSAADDAADERVGRLSPL